MYVELSIVVMIAMTICRHLKKVIEELAYPNAPQPPRTPAYGSSTANRLRTSCIRMSISIRY